MNRQKHIVLTGCSQGLCRALLTPFTDAGHPVSGARPFAPNPTYFMGNPSQSYFSSESGQIIKLFSFKNFVEKAVFLPPNTWANCLDTV